MTSGLDLWEPLRDRIAPGSDIEMPERPAESFSNETIFLTFTKPPSPPHRVVVKIYADDKLDRAKYAAREYAALDLLRVHSVRCPIPILLDTDASVLPSPGIVTERLTGKPSLEYRNDAHRVRELAETLAHIHAIEPSPSQERLFMDSDEEAVYFLHGEKWREMMQAHPDGEEVYRVCHELHEAYRPQMRRLVHLDFWSGNLLWNKGKLTGVVDWEEAAVGNPVYDLAYFQMDLRNVGGQELVDNFTDEYRNASGYEIDQQELAYFQLAASVRAMPDPGGGIAEASVLGDTWSTAESLWQSLRTHISIAMKSLRT